MSWLSKTVKSVSGGSGPLGAAGGLLGTLLGGLSGGGKAAAAPQVASSSSGRILSSGAVIQGTRWLAIGAIGAASVLGAALVGSKLVRRS